MNVYPETASDNTANTAANDTAGDAAAETAVEMTISAKEISGAPMQNGDGAAMAQNPDQMQNAGQAQNSGQAQPLPSLTPSLSQEEAKKTALSHAGMDESAVQFVRSDLELDDGRLQYEVVFYSGEKEYEYEIDAHTGEILSFEQDLEHHLMPGLTDGQNGRTGQEAPAPASFRKNS